MSGLSFSRLKACTAIEITWQKQEEPRASGSPPGISSLACACFRRWCANCAYADVNRRFLSIDPNVTQFHMTYSFLRKFFGTGFAPEVA